MDRLVSDQLDLKVMLEQTSQMHRRYDSLKGYEYHSIEEFVLREGHPTDTEPFTDKEEVLLSYLFEDVQPKRHACYRTATELLWTMHFSRFSGEARYGEGFGISVIPMQHAVFLLNGKAVDIQWHDEIPDLMERARHNLAEVAYWMVAFDVDYLNQILRERGVYGILDDWHNDWPILKEPFKKET